MANSRIRILSRLAFFVCGAVSVLMGNAHRAIFAAVGAIGDPGHVAHGKWDTHSAALAVVGGIALVIALVPSSWIEKLCRVGPDDRRLPSVPIKMLGGFAAFSYFLTVGLYFAPVSWHPNQELVFSLCPACVLAITVDPSLESVLLLLAPLDAAVYGALGGVLGYMQVVLRNRS